MVAVIPGLPKRNATTPFGLPEWGPRSWAEISQRFQRYVFRSQPALQGLQKSTADDEGDRLPKRNLGLELANAFSVSPLAG